jgi:glucan phosphoethanolaminetransferase (alkaline phosphatase superfamily)
MLLVPITLNLNYAIVTHQSLLATILVFIVGEQYRWQRWSMADSQKSDIPADIWCCHI